MPRHGFGRPGPPDLIDMNLSTTDYAVLGLLAERPSHGFALSKQLDSDSEIGRIYKVRRPLVYRSLDRLVDEGYAKPIATEKGSAGPKRVIHQATSSGLSLLRDWLVEPVEHVRDLRIEFLLKLTLMRRSSHSPLHLIRNQREALQPTLSALEDKDAHTDDHVELWRRHNAAAAGAYLDELESHHESE